MSRLVDDSTRPWKFFARFVFYLVSVNNVKMELA